MAGISAEHYVAAGQQIFDALNTFDGIDEEPMFMSDSKGHLEPVRISPTEPVIEINGFEAHEPETLTPQEFVATFCDALVVFKDMKPVTEQEVALLADAVILAWLNRKRAIAMDYALSSTDATADELSGADFNTHIGRFRTYEKAVEAERVYRNYSKALHDQVGAASTGGN